MKYARRWYFHAMALAAVTLVTGCDVQQPEEPTPLAIEALILNRNPNPTVPLAAILTVTTNVPTTATARIRDDERNWDATSSDQLSTEHELVVLGMRPGRLHHITAVVTDADGNALESRALPMEMSPLPADIARPELIASDPTRMEPGVTMFNAFSVDDEGRGVDEFGGVLYIIDDNADVIWFFRTGMDIGDTRRLSNGNIMVESNFSGAAFEIDMLGNTVHWWDPTGTDVGDPPEDAIPVATDSLHHDVYEMPSGNLLSLSSEMRMVDSFPTSDEDPDAELGPAAQIGDIIVEFQRDGTIVREYKLLDILDPGRIGYNSLNGGFWTRQYKPLIEDIEATPMRDWTHSNAVIYDESDDSYIVSVRHQDAVIKVSRETGELIWILGPPEHWKEPWASKRLQPVGDLQWQYHEHGPVLTGDGTLLMYDNGTNRASAFQEKTPLEDLYSRAVEFSIDVNAMQVEQVWTYGGPDDELFYSSYVSDADWLPITGNVLVTDGARETDDNGVNAPRAEGTNYWARIFEVTHTQPAEKVFEMHLKEGGNGNWHIYRAQRLASLYP